MNISTVIGADHAGYTYKKNLIEFLEKELNTTVKDLGTHSEDSTDYPDYAHPVAEAVEKEPNTIGILICGSGNGVAITANKHQNIRAALCWDTEIASLARQHNDANVICIPARFVSLEKAKEMLKAFLTTNFEGGRHERRVQKIACN
ncbi:MAG: ribose 5-phosphate isomerase B [Cytophagales bacterium]|nr:MAG: ribose 5-phosphate isomerase B [Cytophagales bacterium]